MTRQDVKDLFPDATDEQITALLNQNHKELDEEKEKAKQFKVDAQQVVELKKQLESYKQDKSKIAELQRQLDEINDKNLSEVEKAQKEAERIKAESEKQLAEAMSQNEKLQKEMKRTETLKQLAEKGITGDDATNFFTEDGSINFDILGKVLNERATAAAIAKEKEIAENATNPGGGSAGKSTEEEEPADVANIKKISFGGLSDDAQSARDYYK